MQTLKMNYRIEIQKINTATELQTAYLSSLIFFPPSSLKNFILDFITICFSFKFYIYVYIWNYYTMLYFYLFVIVRLGRVWAIPTSVQGLFLVLHSGINPEEALGTIWSAEHHTGSVQGKHYICFIISQTSLFELYVQILTVPFSFICFFKSLFFISL